jgi:hypothetical protein
MVAIATGASDAAPGPRVTLVDASSGGTKRSGGADGSDAGGRAS